MKQKKVLNIFFRSLHWKNDEAKIHGQHYTTARKYAWYVDEQAYYTYSGFKHIAEPDWDAFLLRIKRVEPITEVPFNSCLANLYTDGLQSIG